MIIENITRVLKRFFGDDCEDYTVIEPHAKMVKAEGPLRGRVPDLVIVDEVPSDVGCIEPGRFIPVESITSWRGIAGSPGECAFEGWITEPPLVDTMLKRREHGVK